MPDTDIVLPTHGSHGWDVILNTALTTLCTALNAEVHRATAAEGSSSAHPYVVTNHAGLVGLTSAVEGSTALVLNDGESVAAFYVLTGVDPTVDGNWHQIPYDPAGAAAAVLATAETFATNAVTTAIAGLATVARTGSYTDLTSKPTLGSAAAVSTTAFDAAGTAESVVAELPIVARTGAYADLTGKPTLGTAAAVDTGAFDPAGTAATAVANLVNSAPSLLDTLKELADALGDDPNFATTMTNALALKADASSLGTAASHNVEDFDPANAASAVQTTAEDYTNTSITQLNLHTMSKLVAFDGNTTSYVPSDTDDYQRSAQNPVDASGGPISLLMTRETASGSSPGGQWVLFIKADNSSNAVTIAGDGSGTIDGDPDKSIVLRVQGQSLLLFLNGRSGGDWSSFTGNLPIDGLTSYLDPRYTLSDGGSLQQWATSTPVTRGSVWAYQGVIYERIVDGTGGNIDSTFIRSHWTTLGADPSVVGGGELAATPMTTTYSTAFSANQVKDVTGWTAAPIIPSSGRGIYVDFFCSITSSVAANAVSFALFDVTAGAVALNPSGGACGLYVVTVPATTGAVPIAGRWRVAPAAGSRTYKIQVESHLAATVGILGEDFGFEGMLTFTAR